MTYLQQLAALRREREHLVIENEDPSYHRVAGVDARYARAVRMQGIDREISLLKRENITEVSNALLR